MKKTLLLLCLLCLALSLMACGPKADSEQAPLRVQLIPSKDAEKLNAQRKPLQDLLEAELDMPVEVSVSTDYNGLIEAMKSKKVDVGFLSTTAYVLAKDQGAAEVILTSLRYDYDDDGSKLTDAPMVNSYRAQLVTGADTGIEKVEDLKGKRIAISSFTSTSGFVWPANLLADKGLDPEKDVEWVNVGGHDKAILAVYNGEVDAAFTFKDARNIVVDEVPDVRDKVIFVMDTEPIPNDTISVIPSLDENLKKKITQAFLAITESEEGLQVVRDIYSHQGYKETSDDFFDIVRKYLERQESWTFD